jgi:hypothetical protein
MLNEMKKSLDKLKVWSAASHILSCVISYFSIILFKVKYVLSDRARGNEWIDGMKNSLFNLAPRGFGR